MLPPKLRCPENGKKKFPTVLHARIRAHLIHQTGGPVLYSYHCPHCDSYHLTRQIKFTELIELNLSNP